MAAQTADVHAFLFADLDSIETRGLAAHCVHSSRGDFDILPISKQPAKKPFRDGTAANISCTDKKDAFHGSGGASARDSNLGSNLPESIWRRGSNLETCLESSNRAELVANRSSFHNDLQPRSRARFQFVNHSRSSKSQFPNPRENSIAKSKKRTGHHPLLEMIDEKIKVNSRASVPKLSRAATLFLDNPRRLIAKRDDSPSLPCGRFSRA